MQEFSIGVLDTFHHRLVEYYKGKIIHAIDSNVNQGENKDIVMGKVWAVITFSVKNAIKREMPDVLICGEAIALAIAEKQSSTSGVSQ